VLRAHEKKKPPNNQVKYSSSEQINEFSQAAIIQCSNQDKEPSR